MSYPLNEAMERNLLSAGDQVTQALGRAKHRIESGELTAEQYAQLVDWMGYIRISRGLSHNTGRNYLDNVCQFLGEMNAAGRTMEAVTTAEVESWQQRLYLEHRESSCTRNIRLVAIRQFFDWRERNHLGPNPARPVRGPKKPQPSPRKYSNQQLRAIFATMNRETPKGIRDYAVLLFFLATGARREEVAELNLSQLTLQQRVGMVRLFGKGAKERNLTFEGEVVTALHEWLAVRDSMEAFDADAVFLGIGGRHKGRRLDKSGMHGVITHAQKAAKLKLEEGSALHMLRSTYATRLYDECGDIELVRIAMGHDDINTTRRYIAISDRQLRTRISSDFLDDITGGKRHGTPLWVQQLQKRGRAA